MTYIVTITNISERSIEDSQDAMGPFDTPKEAREAAEAYVKSVYERDCLDGDDPNNWDKWNEGGFIWASDTLLLQDGGDYLILHELWKD